MVKAAFEGLKGCQSPRTVANRRGKKVADIVARRQDGVDEGSELVAAADTREVGNPMREVK